MGPCMYSPSLTHACVHTCDIQFLFSGWGPSICPWLNAAPVTNATFNKYVRKFPILIPVIDCNCGSPLQLASHGREVIWERITSLPQLQTIRHPGVAARLARNVHASHRPSQRKGFPELTSPQTRRLRVNQGVIIKYNLGDAKWD